MPMNIRFSYQSTLAFLSMASLVFAGEIIFSLPFHIARFFRPTVLEVFQLSNTELGNVYAVYGVTAMLAYFPGGVIADYFSAKKLLVASLLSTALGGIYLATIPSAQSLLYLYGYWGVTSILLFWAAMIRATREWGGETAQGRAFGFLDAGRGLVAASVASVAVFLLSASLPSDMSELDIDQRRAAVQNVIYLYSALTVAAAGFIAICLPTSSQQPPENSFAVAGKGLDIRVLKSKVYEVFEVLKNSSIWLQAIIVVCAYCGYKGVDNYTLYAVQVLGLDELSAAKLSSFSAYSRPLAAVLAGFCADRFGASRVITVGFLAMCLSYLLLAGFVAESAGGVVIVLADLLVTLLGVFAIRAVYFALLAEYRVKLASTGTAVGIISVVGFTPDIFFAPVAGRILDAYPGALGHQYFFSLLAAIAFIGIVAILWLALRYRFSKN